MTKLNFYRRFCAARLAFGRYIALPRATADMSEFRDVEVVTLACDPYAPADVYALCGPARSTPWVPFTGWQG